MRRNNNAHICVVQNKKSTDVTDLFIASVHDLLSLVGSEVDKNGQPRSRFTGDLAPIGQMLYKDVKYLQNLRQLWP